MYIFNISRHNICIRLYFVMHILYIYMYINIINNDNIIYYTKNTSETLEAKSQH